MDFSLLKLHSTLNTPAQFSTLELVMVELVFQSNNKIYSALIGGIVCGWIYTDIHNNSAIAIAE